MVQVSYQNSYEKLLKNGWVQVDTPAHMGVKSNLGTFSVNIMLSKMTENMLRMTMTFDLTTDQLNQLQATSRLYLSHI